MNEENTKYQADCPQSINRKRDGREMTPVEVTQEEVDAFNKHMEFTGLLSLEEYVHLLTTDDSAVIKYTFKDSVDDFHAGVLWAKQQAQIRLITNLHERNKQLEERNIQLEERIKRLENR